MKGWVEVKKRFAEKWREIQLDGNAVKILAYSIYVLLFLSRYNVDVFYIINN